MDMKWRLSISNYSVPNPESFREKCLKSGNFYIAVNLKFLGIPVCRQADLILVHFKYLKITHHPFPFLF